MDFVIPPRAPLLSILSCDQQRERTLTLKEDLRRQQSNSYKYIALWIERDCDYERRA